MFKYSFMSRHSTNTREEIKDFLTNTSKPILYTYGLAYRRPTTYKVPITVEKAFEIMAENSTFDLDEYEDYIHLNAYSGNDLW